MKKSKNTVPKICVTLVLSMFILTIVIANLFSLFDISSSKSNEAPAILTEEMSLREENVKHFRNRDGSYIAVMYEEPVHYKSGDIWREIDNSLILSGDHYANNDNPFKVRFPNIINSTSPISVSCDDYQLNFCFEEIDSTQAKIIHPENDAISNSSVTNGTLSQSEKEIESKTALQKNKSSITYANVQPETHLNYCVSGTKLKENIVLESLPARKKFVFRLTYSNLRPNLKGDNSVEFLNGDDEPIFIIDAPYMYDTNDIHSTSIKVLLEETTDGCLYTLIPDRTWLEDANRAWPVTIDPTTSQNSSYIHDNTILCPD